VARPPAPARLFFEARLDTGLLPGVP